MSQAEIDSHKESIRTHQAVIDKLNDNDNNFDFIAFAKKALEFIWIYVKCSRCFRCIEGGLGDKKSSRGSSWISGT